MHELPIPFLLGAASAATQIEGGDVSNSWYDWYRQGHIKDGSSPAVADNHYTLWREDLSLMEQMGIETYRFGVEWSRIEPEEGVFNEEALAHYREEIQAMVSAGIRPLLTLHHFTNPRWFEAMGAFENPRCVEYLLRFSEKVGRAVGDLVPDYITINEPNVYAMEGYLAGEWPPGKRSFSAYRRVLTHMSACHIALYEMIHRVRREMGFTDTRVSFAHHLCAFTPQNPHNPWHRFCTSLAQRGFQDAVTNAMYLGKVGFPLHRHGGIRPGQWCDFIAVNYYRRITVAGLSMNAPQGAAVNDLGWEIDPRGLARVCQKVYDLLPRPIFITENGTCDNNDLYRSRLIYEHLKALCDAGLPVERYYHWCFCDNFEWLEGQSARFGLVHVDYTTQRRTIKRSGEFYAAMIRSRGVSDELYQRYCEVSYPQSGEEVKHE
ncbi:MAG: glycoside hydrolase family 1 protein [Clostridiales bacterium]|nr:glycoside hydrolase family 1 protein [Clostridiales bacterium]